MVTKAIVGAVVSLVVLCVILGVSVHSIILLSIYDVDIISSCQTILFFVRRRVIRKNRTQERRASWILKSGQWSPEHKGVSNESAASS